MAQTSARVHTSGVGREEGEDLDGWRECMMQRQGKDWKEYSGWIERSYDWEQKDVSGIAKEIQLVNYMPVVYVYVFDNSSR